MSQFLDFPTIQGGECDCNPILEKRDKKPTSVFTYIYGICTDTKQAPIPSSTKTQTSSLRPPIWNVCRGLIDHFHQGNLQRINLLIEGRWAKSKNLEEMLKPHKTI